jgi:hypothetical protein
MGAFTHLKRKFGHLDIMLITHLPTTPESTWIGLHRDNNIRCHGSHLVFSSVRRSDTLAPGLVAASSCRPENAFTLRFSRPSVNGVRVFFISPRSGCLLVDISAVIRLGRIPLHPQKRSLHVLSVRKRKIRAGPGRFHLACFPAIVASFFCEFP